MGIKFNRFKTLFVVLILLLLIITGFSALFPSEVMTSKWVMISEQKSVVANNLFDLNGWKNWNDLVVGCSNIKVNSKDSLANLGDSITWTSINGFPGSIVIKSIDTNGLAIEIINQNELPVSSGISLTQRNDSVQVVWSIVEKMRWYPWEKIYGMMASDMKGPALLHSLETFKVQFSLPK